MRKRVDRGFAAAIFFCRMIQPPIRRRHCRAENIVFLSTSQLLSGLSSMLRSGSFRYSPWKPGLTPSSNSILPSVATKLRSQCLTTAFLKLCGQISSQSWVGYSSRASNFVPYGNWRTSSPKSSSIKTFCVCRNKSSRRTSAPGVSAMIHKCNPMVFCHNERF